MRSFAIAKTYVIIKNNKKRHMKQYYVNSRTDEHGFHQVHREDCLHIPYSLHREVLGIHASCVQAVVEAKRLYPKSNGCPVCLAECNTKQSAINSTVDDLIKKAIGNKPHKVFES